MTPSSLLARALFFLATASVAPATPPDGMVLNLPDGQMLPMVWIRPGHFLMGSKEGEPGRRPDEGPATQVALTRGFWLGRTPVTQGQYRAVMGVNPAKFQAAGLDAPVESVSWFQAMDFANRLTDRERQAGRLPAGYRYGLPTEAQWEYACRAGTTGQFYTGESEADLARAAWYKGNAHGTPHPVGQREPNAWGLYDMLGNLWQWCADWYGPSYPGGSVTDPVGPPTGAKRNNRGGSWDNFLGRCRQGARSPDAPQVGNTALGFRLALVSEPSPGEVAVLRAGSLLATVSDGQDRRGYSGLILLADSVEPRDVFVPRYCGLNLEVVQDGTAQPDSVLFETRRNPVRLRGIDGHTAELYQPPTPHWGLESWTRFSLRPGGIVDVTFECVPHRAPAGGHLILSWASYIDHPASPDLYFRAATGWVRKPTPLKGTVPPWWPEDDRREFACAPGLAHRFSHFFDPPQFRYVQPWMFGLCRGRVLAFIFRPEDQIHPGEAHMGGGPGCPAWDFQWPIDRPEVNRRYRMAWRMLYAPAASAEEAEAAVAANSW